MRTESLNSGPYPRYKDITHNGIPLRLFSIGYLRIATSLSIQCLRLWERKGILPSPVFEIPGGCRWYSPAEINFYSMLVRQHYQSGRDLKLLARTLLAHQRRIEQVYSELSPNTLPSTPKEYLVTQWADVKQTLRHNRLRKVIKNEPEQTSSAGRDGFVLSERPNEFQLPEHGDQLRSHPARSGHQPSRHQTKTGRGRQTGGKRTRQTNEHAEAGASASGPVRTTSLP